MPELPDVEAIRRYLVAEALVGRVVTDVELLWPRAVRLPSPTEFEAQLKGRCIREMDRRAKYLVLSLDGRPGRTLLIHLGMSGSLRLRPLRQGPRPEYTRNVLALDGGVELCFVDPRKFGGMWLVRDEAEVLDGLGPEPLEPTFTAEVLAGQFARRKAPVKALLLDQGLVAGIGNIYADEALFLAGIHPLKSGRNLSQKETAGLHAAIVTSLTAAIEPLVTYYAGGGQPIYAQQEPERLSMPRSEGAPCTRCGTAIERVVVRGRSSYVCPSCQQD